MKNKTTLIAGVSMIIMHFLLIGYTALGQDTLKYNEIKTVQFESKRVHNIIITDTLISFVMDNATMGIKVVKKDFRGEGVLYVDNKYGYQYLWVKSKQVLTSYSPKELYTYYYLNRK